ncbi:MAG: hypothetical protein Q7J38_02565 [Gallionella sp.]|nr:hypothetical protein [Gallionella sp.]
MLALQETVYLLALWIVLKCQYIFRLIFEEKNVSTRVDRNSIAIHALHKRRYKVAMMYYNRRRLHSTLDCISPMQFERNWLAAQLKKAA